jgi:hypothetical protein
MTDLTGRTEPVPIEPGYTLEAPDIVGNVEVVDARAHVRSANRGAQEQSLVDALDAEGMETSLMFEMEVAEDRAPVGPDGQRRSSVRATTRSGELAIVLRAEQPRPNRGYAVLYTDEQGLSRWIFPEGEGGGQRRSRELRFFLPRESAPTTESDSERRGPISKLGRRVVRMVMWATDEIVGEGVNAFVRKWEQQKRPYGLRMVSAERIAGEPDWELLRQGRALLLLHGTFSMGEIAFYGLSKSRAFAQIADHYAGRIFAFNHPSLHASPLENIQTLLNSMPDDLSLDLDIVTHSRGGLVGRVLTEQLSALETGNRTLRVHRAIFVAAPLRGTILADGDNWIDLIDRYTNLLTNLPDNVYTLTLEAILTLVKVIGHAGLAKLSGLNSMWPGGDFLRMLNAGVGHEATYYALTADFQPSEQQWFSQLKAKTQDMLVDKLFGEENDGVVPTQGSYAIDRDAPGFPIPEERRRVWALQSDIHHINYFSHDAVNEQIAAWLTA